MIKKLILNRVIFLLFHLISIDLSAQELSNFKLSLKDYHASQITDIISNKSNEMIITTDISGKIISWDTSDFSFIKTIKKGDGFFIEDMQFSEKENTLIYKSKDSLWAIDGNGKVLYKDKFEGDIISSKNSNYIVASTHKDAFSNSNISLFTRGFIPVKSFSTKNKVVASAITTDNKFLAYIEQDYLNNQNIVYRDIENGKIVWESKNDGEHEIVHVFFNKISNQLYTITVSNEEKLLSVYKYTNGERSSKSEISTPYSELTFNTVVSDHFNENNLIIISSNATIFKTKPILISEHNNKFETKVLDIPHGSNAAAYLSNKDVLVTADLFTKNYNDIANFSVTNVKGNKFKKAYPDFKHVFYTGTYLNDDSWLVYGRESTVGDLNVKYFEKGTFNNRFNTLSFDDYLEFKHKVTRYPNSFELNKNEGFLVFSGFDTGTNDNYIYKLNFGKDIVTRLHNRNNTFSTVLDYNNTSGNLLLSPRKYYNRGHTEPQPLGIVINKEFKEIQGNYKFSKFSNDGKFIISINDKNILEIKNLELKTIHTQQLEDGSYKVFAIDKTDFAVSSTDQVIGLNKCNKVTYTFIKVDDNKFNIDKKDCLEFNDIAYKNNIIAMILDGFGLIVNSKPIKMASTEIPKSISFNSDGSKLMVNYASGRIGVLDTSTLEEIGGSFHPSKKEHIFYDNNNHYFSNTDASAFLRLTKEKKEIELNKADKIIFKPNEVLSVYSEPNTEYLKLLNKAIALRKDKKEISNIALKKEENEVLSQSIEKGDLYIMTVGVSNYKQDGYDLTFADKDAFDIATVYGDLDSTTINTFHTKFLGSKLKLRSYNNDHTNTILKLKSEYQSVGDLFPLNSESTLWLEYNNYQKEAYLLNYNTNKIEPFKLPEDFNMDGYNLGKKVYTAGDSNFYLKTENAVFYNINIETKKHKKVELPFPINYQQESNNIKFLNKNDCFYFKDKSSSIGAYFGKVNTRTIDSTLINTSFCKSIFDASIKESFMYNPQFKDITNSGEYLLFRGGDDSAYLMALTKDTIPTKLPIKIEYGDDASLSQDAKTITVLKSSLKDYRYKLVTYSLDGTIINTETLVDKEFNIKGINIENSQPKWIKESKSLVDKINYNFKVDKDLVAAKPSSFKAVHVNLLTNEKATKKEIENQIKTFFSKAKANDQIMLFIAGHGVLDTNKDYYYAPHNMNFDNVSTTGLAFKTIVNEMANAKAKQKLLLMDTCHSGFTFDVDSNQVTSVKPNVEGERGGIGKATKVKSNFKMSDIVTGLFDDFISTSGVTILSASSGADVAYENNTLGNGAFTTAYLKILKDSLGGGFGGEDALKKELELTDNFIQNVFKQVMKTTSGKQIPDIREINNKVIIKVW